MKISKIKKYLFNHIPDNVLAQILSINRSYLFELKKFGVNDYKLHSDNVSIFVTRPKRLFKYKNGVDKRFDQILMKYFIKEINFSKNDVIIDCGSNIGELPMAIRATNKEVVRIIAIEPDPIEFNVLRKNLKNSDFLYNYFLSDKSALQEAIYSNNSGDTCLLLQTNSLNQGISTVSVRAHTLDSVILPINLKSIKLLKIEVEGFEPEVIKGATEVLKITSYVAVDTGPERDNTFTFSKVNKLLTKAGFELLKNNNNFSVLFKKVRF